MISIAEIILIQDVLIDKFGGTRGVRDRGLLESAISRPFHTFDNADLFPTAIEKASALIEGILINHPFLDGNKRIGYVAARLFLMDSGLDLSATED